MEKVKSEKWHLKNGQLIGSDGFFKGTVEADLEIGGWKFTIKFYDRNGNILTNQSMKSAKEISSFRSGEKEAVMLSLKYLVDDFFNLKDSTEKNKTTIMRRNN